MLAMCGKDLNLLITFFKILRTINHEFSAAEISGLGKLVEENFPRDVLTHIKLSPKEVECRERTVCR